ncbi:hypothetical protein E2C01_037250 [Portunus trituberculatus]|uniref:Uncharacterized protein n=1 Tax=Portunus trituberculatus TaxID=210409 RepID=A0A5B7FEG5_PORTR|nr:hypothetical protein [Portunus trituberculatus]
MNSCLTISSWVHRSLHQRSIAPGGLSNTLDLRDALALSLHDQLSIRFGPRVGYWHITHEKYEPWVDYVIRARKLAPSQGGDWPSSPTSRLRGLLIHYLTDAHYALPILIPQQFGLTEKQRSRGRGAGWSGACATITLPAAVSAGDSSPARDTPTPATVSVGVKRRSGGTARLIVHSLAEAECTHFMHEAAETVTVHQGQGVTGTRPNAPRSGCFAAPVNRSINLARLAFASRLTTCERDISLSLAKCFLMPLLGPRSQQAGQAGQGLSLLKQKRGASLPPASIRAPWLAALSSPSSRRHVPHPATSYLTNNKSRKQTLSKSMSLIYILS